MGSLGGGCVTSGPGTGPADPGLHLTWAPTTRCDATPRQTAHSTGPRTSTPRPSPWSAARAGASCCARAPGDDPGADSRPAPSPSLLSRLGAGLWSGSEERRLEGSLPGRGGAGGGSVVVGIMEGAGIYAMPRAAWRSSATAGTRDPRPWLAGRPRADRRWAAPAQRALERWTGAEREEGVQRGGGRGLPPAHPRLLPPSRQGRGRAGVLALPGTATEAPGAGSRDGRQQAMGAPLGRIVLIAAAAAGDTGGGRGGVAGGPAAVQTVGGAWRSTGLLWGGGGGSDDDEVQAGTHDMRSCRSRRGQAVDNSRRRRRTCPCCTGILQCCCIPRESLTPALAEPPTSIVQAQVQAGAGSPHHARGGSRGAPRRRGRSSPA